MKHKKAKPSKADAKRFAKALAEASTKTDQMVSEVIRETPPATPEKIKINREHRLVAVMCPLLSEDDAITPCGETFTLKKRGDRTTYNLAAWDRHLRDVHGLRLPSPVDVMGY